MDDITHVINYNLPDEPDRYTHRSGRTARAGKSGVSIVLVNTRRFFMNVGRLDRLKESAIVRLVCDKSGISSRKLGRIQLKREFSFFDVEKSVAKKVLKSLKGATLDGRKICAKFAD